MAKLHFQQTRLLTSLTDKHYSLDSKVKMTSTQGVKMSVTNNITVLFTTTLTPTITLNKLLIPLGSNHLLRMQ